jgi:hypothetical protein
MSAEDPLEELAGSILDGSEVDWELAEEDSDGDGSTGRIRALRELERIVELHRALQRDAEGAAMPADGEESTESDPADS